MQCIGSIESCPSHHLDEKATILMKYSFALFAFASSVLLSGCSKPSEPQPEIVRPLVKDSRLLVKELGVVKLTNQTPSRNDLGDGKVCIINPVLRADGNLELSMLIERSGTNAAPRADRCTKGNSIQRPTCGNCDTKHDHRADAHDESLTWR